MYTLLKKKFGIPEDHKKALELNWRLVNFIPSLSPQGNSTRTCGIDFDESAQKGES